MLLGFCLGILYWLYYCISLRFFRKRTNNYRAYITNLEKNVFFDFVVFWIPFLLHWFFDFAGNDFYKVATWYLGVISIGYITLAILKNLKKNKF